MLKNFVCNSTPTITGKTKIRRKNSAKESCPYADACEVPLHDASVSDGGNVGRELS